MLRQTTRITATAVGEFADTAETTSGKPEGTAVWERVQSPVTTIAVHVVVTNQQLDDAPEIRTVIDEDLRFEIEEELNRQVLLGAGASDDLAGILDEAPTNNITEGTCLVANFGTHAICVRPGVGLARTRTCSSGLAPGSHPDQAWWTSGQPLRA